MPALRAAELREHAVRGRERTIVVTALAVSSVVVVLMALGFWMFFINVLSDPVSPGIVGMRIDGDAVTVKAGQCPQDRVRRVEVWDSDTERLIWRGDGPLTEEGRSGLLPLWDAKAYGTASAAARPSELPETLDVSIDHGPEYGVEEVFDIAKVRAADLPPGSYWTRDGVRTARQLDGIPYCGGSGAP
ncbi:hypothetical protein GTY40_21330 [Streptomyces sp. SID8359]|uniref:hypothetical protein n=1 Tax=unclassified Streptomyces TaxID=2593676 RepID=UPI00048D8463|nr:MULTISPECIES: hypothetical protein [unclassified Streptomyces]MYT93573.1 hypothetical protein [Streptomyces sp. SID8359]